MANSQDEGAIMWEDVIDQNRHQTDNKIEDLISSELKHSSGKLPSSFELNELTLLKERYQRKAAKLLLKVPLDEISGYSVGILCSDGPKMRTTSVFRDIKVYKSPISNVYIIMGPTYSTACPNISELENSLLRDIGHFGSQEKNIPQPVKKEAEKTYYSLSMLFEGRKDLNLHTSEEKPEAPETKSDTNPLINTDKSKKEGDTPADDNPSKKLDLDVILKSVWTSQ